MKFNAIEGVEDICIFLGIALSIDQIKSIFGIILLSFQIILLLTKGIIAIRKRLKNKDIEGAIDELDKTTNDIKNIVDKHENDGK